MSVEQPDRTPADFGWTERPRVAALWDPLLDDSARVTLGMVASAHHLSVSHDRPEVRDEARLLKRNLRTKFERQNGSVRNSYFCMHLPGATDMVERAGQVLAGQPSSPDGQQPPQAL